MPDVELKILLVNALFAGITCEIQYCECEGAAKKSAAGMQKYAELRKHYCAVQVGVKE